MERYVYVIVDVSGVIFTFNSGVWRSAHNFPTLLHFQTAISYICSTNLTQFLDIFLQLPNIDVNRADNEGNTPLHFASEAGTYTMRWPPALF